MLNRSFIFVLITLLTIGSVSQMGTLRGVSAENQPLTLPINVKTFKIVVEEEGIYEISQPELAAAGMDVANVDPATLTMMHRGEAVNYDFIGDGDAQFEADEKVRFYGGRFTDSRHEEHFYLNSVFWLWAEGSGPRMEMVNNDTGNPVAAHWPSSITVDPMLYFYPTYTDRWHSFENEADAWYWMKFRNAQPQTIPFELPNPVASEAGEMVVEITSFAATDVYNHDVKVQIGDSPITNRVWDGVRNVNIVNTIPAGTLVDGENTILLTGDTRDIDGNLRYDEFHLNRITVDYRREFVAVDDQLIFEYDGTGGTDFMVSGLSTSNVIAWDLSDVLKPEKVAVGSGDVNGGVLHFGRNLPNNAKFIVTTPANLLSPTDISAYTPVDIEPAGGAEWVAIAHHTMLAETQRLATHRTATSHISTHVVDVEDVYNQFGYGYPIPAAIKNYAQNAYDNWATPIRYLVLVGDATQNPVKLPCSECTSTWNNNYLDEDTFVVTDLRFEDRFLGLIPTDHTYTLLEGNDVKPDIAVGRLSSRTADEVRIFVDKIIEYDQSTMVKESWTRRFIFLADNRDAGGNFCFENEHVASDLPTDFAQTAFCLDEYGGDSSQAKGQMRSDFFNELASNSAGIVNYRGHGSITDWGSGIVKREDSNLFLNIDRPTVIISADCLDGNFVWIGTTALSETFLRLEGRGTAAHWGSSGLGYSSEHTVMHTGFYEALYNGNARTIGDAIQFSKTRYIDLAQHESEAYGFILHGDPAMLLPSTQEADVATTSETNNQSDAPAAQVSYDVTVTNQGTGQDTFDVSLAGNAWAASADITTVSLAANESATVRVTHTIAPTALADETDSITVTARSRFNNTVSDSTTLETTATAVYSVAASATVTSKEGAGQTTVTYAVDIENKSNTAATFGITVEDNQWTVDAPSSISLEIGETKTIEISHVIPLLLETTDDTMTVIVTSSADSSVTDSVTLTTSAEVFQLFLPVVRKASN